MAGSHLTTWYSGFRVEKFTSGRGPLFLYMNQSAEKPEIVLVPPRKSTSPELERNLGDEIRKHAAAIIAGLIEKAEEGGAVQAKFLFDFAGISASPPAEEQGESLLDIMRRELALEEPPEGTVE